jgi:hypothetical protein
VFAFVDQAARRDQGARRPACEFTRQDERAVAKCGIVKDFADQSPLLGLIGRERLVGHHQFERALPADKARQQPGRTEIGDQRDAAEHLNEARRTRRDDHVARHRKAEPAARRHAVDGDHDRHAALAQRLERRPVILHHAGGDVVAQDLRGLEVLARAEAPAGAGQHQRSHLRIVVYFADGCREIAQQVGRHRVQGLRLIQCQHADAAVALPLHTRHFATSVRRHFWPAWPGARVTLMPPRATIASRRLDRNRRSPRYLADWT